MSSRMETMTTVEQASEAWDAFRTDQLEIHTKAMKKIHSQNELTAT